ncbi:hypothetical protein [Prevotella sp. HUN102]|uniref:hypothetical protein n=1 Tax=Prevotella sp. HUN102 TaxID=1392486 RepID=UPI00048BEDB4|nr:hypothetical protein [Prevotella sp. HUN102]
MVTEVLSIPLSLAHLAVRILWEWRSISVYNFVTKFRKNIEICKQYAEIKHREKEIFLVARFNSGSRQALQ